MEKIQDMEKMDDEIQRKSDECSYPRRLKLSQVIPSPEVRKALRAEGRKFTDSETLILLRQAKMPLEDKADLLRQIHDRTDDVKLADGIGKWAAYIEKSMDRMAEHDGTVIYVLHQWDDARLNKVGYFAELDAAIAAGVDLGEEFSISKEPLFGAEAGGVPSKKKDVDGLASYWSLGDAEFDKKGHMVSVDALNRDEKTDILGCRSFEAFPIGKGYVELPNPFERGDIVKTAYDPLHRRYVGVISEDLDEWKGVQTDITEGKTRASGRMPEFKDLEVKLERMDYAGGTTSERTIPIWLTRLKDDEIEKLWQKKELMELGRKLGRGVGKKRSKPERLKKDPLPQGKDNGESSLDADGLDWAKLIPSPEVREAAREEKWEFSDRDAATFSMNMDAPLEEKHRFLSIIRERTTDTWLQEQIDRELGEYRRRMTLFMGNGKDRDDSGEIPEKSDGAADGGGTIYALRVMDEDEDIYGYFRKAEDAISYGTKSEYPFVVEKYVLFGDGGQPVLTHEELGDAPLLDGDYAWNGCDCGYASFDEKGRLWSFYLRGVFQEDDPEEPDYGDTIGGRYVSVPYPFKVGDLVTIIGNDGYVGIVSTSKQDWDRSEENIAQGKWDADYFDVQTVINDITEEGYMDHRHVNPIQLRRLSEDEIKELPQKELALALQKVLREKSGIQWLMMCYDQCASLRKG